MANLVRPGQAPVALFAAGAGVEAESTPDSVSIELRPVSSIATIQFTSQHQNDSTHTIDNLDKQFEPDASSLSKSHITHTPDSRSILVAERACPLDDSETVQNVTRPSNKKVAAIVICLSGVNMLSSISTGLLTVGLPQMAIDVHLPAHLLLWPSSVYALTCGSCLMLAGSVGDVGGNRRVNLLGCFVFGCFIIACGLARTGIELIMFRALQGVAVSLCLPTSVAIVATSTQSGRQRNVGFSCLGFVQPVGFSVGLVLEGLFLDTVGWRFAFFLCGGLTLALFIVSLWALPPDESSLRSSIVRFKTEIDWIGALMACTCLALFSYVLSTLTSGISKIHQPVNIVLLVISISLVPIFALWERRQEHLKKPALIPNSLWRNPVFTTVCLTVVLSYAVMNAMELLCSLFYQQVQRHSALQASIRILPSLVLATAQQLLIGILIHRIPAYSLVVAGIVLAAGAPLLMALIHVSWSYWYDAFFAQLLAPISVSTIFPVGLLVISETFPTRTQALAGAVFNTVAQFGTSIGLSIMAVISSSVTNGSSFPDKTSPAALMLGYRASFWAAFGWMAFALVLAAVGLRGIGRVGLKRD